MRFRYYDKDGSLICEADTVEEMSEKSGLTDKQISQRVRSWRHRIETPNIRKPACPYMECDDETFAAKNDMGQKFVKMYFEGRSRDEIQDELHATDGQIRYLYKIQLGIMPPKKKSEKDDNLQKKFIPESFWREWDRVRLSLLKSGANLNIKITYTE